ncbi:MAG: pantoate--beta-alanine ligase, partial [Nitrospira sp.]|nr:pantoate--beta-alanine ligase [Nitrospira sp.]
AVTLYKSLQAGAKVIRTGGTDAKTVRSAMAQVITRESTITTDYLTVCDPLTLEPVASVRSRVVLLGAIRLGSVRLIDNLLVNTPPQNS